MQDVKGHRVSQSIRDGFKKHRASHHLRRQPPASARTVAALPGDRSAGIELPARLRDRPAVRGLRAQRSPLLGRIRLTHRTTRLIAPAWPASFSTGREKVLRGTQARIRIKTACFRYLRGIPAGLRREPFEPGRSCARHPRCAKMLVPGAGLSSAAFLSRRGDLSSLPPALLLIDLFVEELRPAFLTSPAEVSEDEKPGAGPSRQHISPAARTPPAPGAR